MPDYKTMYFRLAARVADAAEILLAAQEEGEDAFAADDKSGIQLDDKKDQG